MPDDLGRCRVSGLPCAYPRCTHVSIEGTLDELESEGWIVFAPFDRKPVAFCPYCPREIPEIEA